MQKMNEFPRFLICVLNLYQQPLPGELHISPNLMGNIVHPCVILFTFMWYKNPCGQPFKYGNRKHCVAIAQYKRSSCHFPRPIQFIALGSTA